MFNFGKRGQMTVYVAEDLREAFAHFASEHPIASASDITNAALRLYLPLASTGVDGRLMPFNVPSGARGLDSSAAHTLKEMFNELTKRYEDLNTKYEAQRRVVWNDAQREQFRNEHAPPPVGKTRRKPK